MDLRVSLLFMKLFFHHLANDKLYFARLGEMEQGSKSPPLMEKPPK